MVKGALSPLDDDDGRPPYNNIQDLLIRKWIPKDQKSEIPCHLFLTS